jgi:DNA replication protein DnaC
LSIVAQTHNDWSAATNQIVAHCEAAYEQGLLEGRARLAECERVAEAMAKRLRLNKTISKLKVKSIDSDTIFVKEDAEALNSYEAYKSSHEVKK